MRESVKFTLPEQASDKHQNSTTINSTKLSFDRVKDCDAGLTFSESEIEDGIVKYMSSLGINMLTDSLEKQNNYFSKIKL